jgi:uncharacterized protein (DUF4415 family)
MALARLAGQGATLYYTHQNIAEFWNAMTRSIKSPVTIRVDADVLAWLKRQGRGQQTRINKLLREAMEG